MTANIVTLGVISSIIEEVDKEKLKFAILKRVPKGTEETNIIAFEEGTKLLRK